MKAKLHFHIMLILFAVTGMVLKIYIILIRQTKMEIREDGLVSHSINLSVAIKMLQTLKIPKYQNHLQNHHLLIMLQISNVQWNILNL